MNLLWIKNIHITCVASSYALFFLRGVWLIQGSHKLRQRWVKTIPHVMDTMLLVSAITLAIGIRQYPGVDAWLTAKVIGLVFYIGLGMMAFRFGKTMRVKISAWVAAQLVFFYIVAVALTHNPLPFPALYNNLKLVRINQQPLVSYSRLRNKLNCSCAKKQGEGMPSVPLRSLSL